MNATTLGLAFGIALGLAAAFGGFGAFLTVLCLAPSGCSPGAWPRASSTCPSSPTGTRAEDHQPTALGHRTPSVTS
jgi:hypothetical protein